VEVGGGGAGAGGLWARVTAGRSEIAIAVRAKMRIWWLIDRFLGRKHDEMSKIVGRRSVQVKAQDSKAPARPCADRRSWLERQECYWEFTFGGQATPRVGGIWWRRDTGCLVMRFDRQEEPR